MGFITSAFLSKPAANPIGFEKSKPNKRKSGDCPGYRR